ncbi:hypothetical protein ACFW04_010950 [Cataglyphis niger]
MLRKLFSEFLPIIRHYEFTTKVNFANTLKRNIKHQCRRLSTSLHVKTNNNTLPVDEELQEIFKLKNIKISNWIIENKVHALCVRYTESNKKNRQQILRTLALQYAVQHNDICQVAKKLLCTELENERQMIVHERTLKNVLIPAYHWLFFIIGRLQNGVKFLVDLRTDVLVNKTNLYYK